MGKRLTMYIIQLLKARLRLAEPTEEMMRTLHVVDSLNAMTMAALTS